MGNCFLIFGVTVTTLVAMIVGLYLNQNLPEGLPYDQQFGARFVGANLDISRFLGHAASFVGIGDSPIENLNYLLNVAEQIFAPDEEPGLDVYDTKIANVPVRVYKPKHPDTKPTGVVYIHGGGWTIGSVATYHPLTYQLAKEANAVLISVEYRLAPKHTFPTQFHDCYSVVTTVLNTADKYGIDPNRVVVAGDSAGGNLATAIALKLRDENKRLAAQILLYPAVQFLDLALPSLKTRDSPILTQREMAEYWSYYMTGTPNLASTFLANNHSVHLRNTKYSSYVGVKDKEQQKALKTPPGNIPKAVIDGLIDYRVSPLMADSLKGLPKTLLTTCEYDVLKDDGLLYKARLLGEGVKVTHLNYMTYHAFLAYQSVPFLTTEEFRQGLRDITDYLKAL